MAVTWHKTNFLGVRYREHAERKHGIKPDRCFSIRYKLNGKDKEEVAGWAFEGMSAEKAFKLLSTVRENIKSGAGAKSLAEMKERNAAREAADARERAAAAKGEVTFSEFWAAEYWPAQTLKTAFSLQTEDGYYRKWLLPAFGDIPLGILTLPSWKR